MAGMMDVAFPDPNEAEAAPSDNLYVCDLPAGTSEDSLRGMFGPGVVQCRVLPSKTQGQGTVALVRFSSTKEAILVRETLNGAIPPGQQRPVTIRFCGGSKPEAKPAGAVAGAGGAPSYTKAVIAAAAHAARQSPYGAGACGGKGSVAAQAQAEGPTPNDNLYITGLPPGIDNASLLGLFSQYGQVVQCKVLPSPNEGMPPHALVRFSSMDEAAAVKKSLTGYALEGVNEPLVIEFALQKSSKNSEGWGAKGDSPAGKGSWDGGKGSEGGWDGGKGCEGGGHPAATDGGWDGKGGSDGWGGKGGNDGGWGGKGGNDGWGGKGGSDGWGGKGGSDGSWGGSKGFDEGSKGSWGGSKGFDESGKGGSKGSWGSSKGFDESGKGSWGGKGYEEESGAGGWGGQEDAEEEDGSAKGSCKGAGKVGGGKAGAGGKSGGKVDRTQFTPEWGGMDRILQGFVEAACLPGHKLGNEDNCLFVSGLPKDCDDVHLYRLLAPFGAITPTGVKAMKHPDGACKGFGFVNFVENESLQAAAMMLHGTQMPDGSALSVVPKKSKKEQGRKGAGKTVPAPNREAEQQDMLG